MIRSSTFPVCAETLIPETIRRKVSRCLSAPVETLVEREIITSGETLARVIPQVTSRLQAAAFEDPRARTLYSAIYRAFRKRRSLLLLNLESQVRIEELPWIAEMERFRRKDFSTREVARRTLKEVTLLVLRAFPQAIIPNKLLQELRALAKTAEMDLPLVEELAADIFRDAFTPKFTAAAKRAANVIDRSLYARYYNIDSAAVRALPDQATSPPRSWFRSKPAPNALVAMCIARAGVSPVPSWDVARNGMIIEQAQILTTQNLAVLFEAFNLAEELREDLRGMSERCFRWICLRQQVKADPWHATLIMLKNTAYAWRQMVFYLSLQSDAAIREFLAWAENHLQQYPETFTTRFRPALRGLAAAQSAPFDDSLQSLEARRFLGWTRNRHWILGPEPHKTSG